MLWSSRFTRFLLALVALTWSGAAKADVADSQSWFSGLSQGDRVVVQVDLVLVGTYDALVDGVFGPSTFKAVIAYQRSRGHAPTGVLDPPSLAQLKAEGSAIFQSLGFQEVKDAPADLDLYLPSSILTEKEPLASGTHYSSADGVFDLKTNTIKGPDAFGAVYAAASTSRDEVNVTYAANSGSTFSVAGKNGVRYFYERFYQSGDGTSGYTLSWDRGSNDRGSIIATLMASLSAPLGKNDVTIDQEASSSAGAAATGSPTAEVPVQLNGGTFTVPVLINGAITLNFMIDSGSSDVSIPADVVLTLIRAGTIAKDDFLGTQTYTLADGTTVPSQTFRIHSLKVGDVVVENATGSVGSPSGTLLLGQSFLSHFQKWSIDNKRQLLVLN